MTPYLTWKVSKYAPIYTQYSLNMLFELCVDKTCLLSMTLYFCGYFCVVSFEDAALSQKLIEYVVGTDLQF